MDFISKKNQLSGAFLFMIWLMVLFGDVTAQRDQDTGNPRNRGGRAVPERVHVHVTKAKRSDIQGIDKHDYYVPRDLSVAQLMYIIRRRIRLPSNKSMYLFVNKILPTTSATMGAIFEEYKSEDNILYVKYSGENVFA